MRLKGFAVLIFTALFGGMLGGCVSEDPDDPNRRVSNIPFNRPEKWEGQGPMGGMVPGSQ